MEASCKAELMVQRTALQSENEVNLELRQWQIGTIRYGPCSDYEGVCRQHIPLGFGSRYFNLTELIPRSGPGEHT